jgi:hypothetical protein
MLGSHRVMRDEDSELELPVSRRFTILKVGAVLLLNAALVTGGVFMILRYLALRQAPPSRQGTLVDGPAGPAPVVRRVLPDGGIVSQPTTVVSTEPQLIPTPVAHVVRSDAGIQIVVVMPEIPDAAPPPPRRPDAALPVDAAIPVVTPVVPDAGAPVRTPDAAVFSQPPLTPDAAVVDEEVTISSAEVVRQVIAQHRDQVNECNARSAKDGVPLVGRVDIHMTILPTGEAVDLGVESNETGSVELGTCLIELLKTWRFSNIGRDTMEFVWPFVFRADN